MLDSDGDVSLSAASSSAINATVAAAAVAVGGGGTAGIGVSIGISVARNFIGWTPDGTAIPVDVKAYLDNTSVHADDDLTITALAGQTIDSLVLAGSAAIALGGTAGIAVAGSGVFAENKIGVDLAAYIEGDRGGVGDSGPAGIAADSITLTADDTSTIHTFAGAASIAVAFGGTVGLSVAVGVSLARNTITSDVDAYILDADGLAANALLPATLADHGVDATGPGGITLRATENASISAVAAAASVAVGIGPSAAGIAVSGAGADANNVILTDTHAYIEGSSVHSAGKVDIDAANTASIDATIISVALSLGVGLWAGIGASIGVAMAHNDIGFSPDYLEHGTYKTGANPATIANGQTVEIADGAGKGNVYQYIGALALARPTTGSATEQANWLTRLDYGDVSKWKLVNLDRNAAETRAWIADSNVNATGALTIDAVADQDIDATVFAGAVALSGGFVGVSLSGAGASADNRIASFVEARIEGTKDARGITAGSVRLFADDTSEIDAFTGAVSVAAAVGVIGAAFSIGVGIAYNEIDNDVAATIVDVAVDKTDALGVVTTTGIKTTSGSIVLEAHEDATITATTAAASAAVMLGLAGGSLSGAGAFASNVILGSATALVDESALDSFDDVTLVADNDSTDRRQGARRLGGDRRQRVRRRGPVDRRRDRAQLDRLRRGRHLFADRSGRLDRRLDGRWPAATSR